MGRRLWWSGIASMAMGYVLIGVSLGTGNLVLVEPLIAANLIFALPVAAARCRRVPQRRSMLGAVALAAGVAGFVLAARPTGGRIDDVPAVHWMLAVAVGGAVIAGTGAFAWRGHGGWRRHGDRRALLLGIATGTEYGMQDGLTRDVYGVFSHSGVGAFAGWHVWTLVLVGALGVLLAQNAFDCAPLTSSLPAISIVEPFVGIVLGVALFDSHLRTSLPALVVAGFSLVVMFAGAYLVSRARVVREATTPRSAQAETRQAA